MTDDTDRTERGLGSFNDWLDRVIVELEAAGQALPGGQGDHYRDLADAGRRHRSRLRSSGDPGGDERPREALNAVMSFAYRHSEGNPRIVDRLNELGAWLDGLRATSTDAPSLAGCPVCDAGEIYEDHDGEFYCTDCSFRGRVCHTNHNRTPTSRSYVSYDDELRVEHGQLARSTDAPEERAVTIACENPDCDAGCDPFPLHDGDVYGYCQACCEESLVLRIHADAAPVRGEERFTISRERLFHMISTAFDDGTHANREGDMTAEDVRMESDRYAETFVGQTWWRAEPAHEGKGER